VTADDLKEENSLRDVGPKGTMGQLSTAVLKYERYG